MMACFKVKRHEKCLIKNGGIFLEELVAFSNGRSNPIHHFSANELRIATNNYDSSQIFVQDFDYKLYKGCLNDRPIFVKKYDKYRVVGNFAAMPHKDIAIGSQMSVHNNVLKVIGCCLETKIPTIVYEFAEAIILSRCISALPWKCRLKIAVDLANAIAYLHTAFPRPVIHRDIKSSTIILDENNVPKLIDFGICVPIPEGQSHVEDVDVVRQWFPAPEYWDRGYLTEKADVYSFGVLLSELLTGKRLSSDILFMEHRFNNLNHCVEEHDLYPRTENYGSEFKEVLDFAILADRCISYDGEKRPTMINVARELRRIYETHLMMEEINVAREEVRLILCTDH